MLNQTPENIASNQLSAQEAEARYERVVISCLQGYAMYLKEVSEENIMECITMNTQIISNKKFWKLATSKVPLVRSSWFQVLSVILQDAIFLLKNKESQTLSTIFNNLEDDEPNVLPHVWECLLLATSISVSLCLHATLKFVFNIKEGEWSEKYQMCFVSGVIIMGEACSISRGSKGKGVHPPTAEKYKFIIFLTKYFYNINLH